MSDGVKLEACPLCGREPEINRHAVFQIHCTQTYPGQHIVCVTERTEAEAIAAWNTRKSDDGWRTMESAPKDGTLVLLLVDYSDEDADHWIDDREDGLSRTIGHNNDDNVGEGEGQGWQFAGWCWTHDHYVEGKGRPTHWRPLPSPPEG